MAEPQKRPGEDLPEDEQQEPFVPSPPGKRIIAWTAVVYMVMIVLLNVYPFFHMGEYLYGVYPLMICPGAAGLFVLAVYQLKQRPSGGKKVGMILLAAYEQYQKGMPLDELVGWIDGFKHKVEAWFTVDDLAHLYRGGRISGAVAAAGKMLKIKPILRIDESGALISMEKVNGRKKSIKRLAEIYGERGGKHPDKPVMICHGDCLDEAEKLRERVMEKYGSQKVDIFCVGPIIGTHVGPGILGIVFLGE